MAPVEETAKLLISCNNGKVMAEKRKKVSYFHSKWEEEFFFTTMIKKYTCSICGVIVARAKRHNVERQDFNISRNLNHFN